MAAASQSDSHRREPGQRRPMCGVCTKPIRLCLCGRLHSPPVETAVGVTVLQHAMESNHPLNSTRVARLGLRNLVVAQVTDVNHCARFLLTTLGAGGGAAASDLGGGKAGPVAAAARAGCHDGSNRPGEIDKQTDDGLARFEGEGLKPALHPNGICVQEPDKTAGATYDSEQTAHNACGDLVEEDMSLGGSSGRLDLGDVRDGIFVGEVDSLGCCHNGGESFRIQKGVERPRSAANQIANFGANAVNNGNNHRIQTGLAYKANGNLAHRVSANGPEVNGIIHHSNRVGKEKEDNAALGQDWTTEKMDKCAIAYTDKELRIDIERGVKPKVRWLSRGPLGQAAVLDGFVVTKIQTKKSKLTGEVTEFEEFSITIPPKSALLFPCQRAVSIDASGCQVQHLIVLDGTWAKAQRMYHENPWLQLLPHVKLESDRVSLYSEVRHEPRAGCLSTIESIVVAMRKLGEDSKGLDDLLDVFESMIADQRRCKDENCKRRQESES